MRTDTVWEEQSTLSCVTFSHRNNVDSGYGSLIVRSYYHAHSKLKPCISRILTNTDTGILHM